MKVRVKIKQEWLGSSCFYYIQEKKWWGWNTLYKTPVFSYCVGVLDELSKVRNVELIKD